jgi:aspartyl-tRNA(Asn)/glutamyl-tRNA(Gln) amidotransferase subunit C
MDKNELHTTAELAMLDLTEDEERQLGEAVTQLLHYFDKMMEIDVEELEPTTHALARENRLREDVPDIVEETHLNVRTQCEDIAEEMLENAPETDDRFIIIPKVL